MRLTTHQAESSCVTPPGSPVGTLQEEFDFYTWYEINRPVHIGTGVGHILPGGFMAMAGKGAAYTYPYFVIEMFDGKRVR